MQARELFEELEVAMHPAYSDVLLGLGRYEMSHGEIDRALPLLERVDEFWSEFGPGNRFAGEAAFWLASGYAELGRDPAATEAFERASLILSASPHPSARSLLSAIPD